jgi:hypothetical protein
VSTGLASTWRLDDPEEFGWVKPPAKKRSKQSLGAIVCKHCGLAGHSRTSSRQCLKHRPTNKPAGTADTVPEQEDPVDSEEDAANDVDQYETLEAHLQRHAVEDADDSRNNSNENDKDSEVQHVSVL